VSAGTSENARSNAPPSGLGCSQNPGIVTCGPCQLENGLNHPPSHSVTAIDETAIMAAYSARKKSDQRKPLYSVWNPATSSDSASGRSNGARFVSATIATAKTKRAISPKGKNLKTNHAPWACCACTIPIMLNVPTPFALVPALYSPQPLNEVIRIADTTASPMAIS